MDILHILCDNLGLPQHRRKQEMVQAIQEHVQIHPQTNLNEILAAAADGDPQEEGQEAPPQLPHPAVRQGIAQVSLEFVREKVWLLKPMVRDWVPLDLPLHLHLQRCSLCFVQLYSGTGISSPRPGDAILNMGYRRVTPDRPLQDDNIEMNFGVEH